METDHEQIKNLLTETLTLLLRSGVKFKQQLSIEGLLGVHIDKQDVFFVHITKTFEDEKYKKAQESAASSPPEIVNVDEGKQTESTERRKTICGRRSRDRPRVNYEESSILDEFVDSPQTKRRRTEADPMRDSGEQDKPYTVSVKQDPSSRDDISVTSEYEQSENSIGRIKVEPSEYQDDEEDPDHSQSSFTTDSKPHPIALYSAGSREGNTSNTNIASTSSWPDGSFSESYEHIQGLDDDETISEVSDPYVIQPNMQQWAVGSDGQAGPSTSQSSFGSWHQAPSEQDPQGEEGILGPLLPPPEQSHLRAVIKQKYLPRAEARRLRSELQRLNTAQLVYGSRNYPCHICGRVTNRPSDLVKHLRVHTGEKPFECHVCHARFKSSSPLYSHLRKKHGWQQGEKLLRDLPEHTPNADGSTPPEILDSLKQGLEDFPGTKMDKSD